MAVRELTSGKGNAMSRNVDFARIPSRQDAIHIRLEQWGRWVRVHPAAWALQPIWRNAKTPRQWDVNPHINQPLNTLECHETERAVSLLPDKHKTVLRWLYVWPWVHEGKVRRETASTSDALYEVSIDARDMVIDRLKQKLSSFYENA